MPCELHDVLRKYPRTPHLSNSPGATSDDRWLSPEGLMLLRSASDLVVTEKMDGGNVTLTKDGFHARSLDTTSAPAWERRAKAEWARVRADIPPGWRVSCESMWVHRSISYTNLPGVLLVIGVWGETNTLLSWDATCEWSQLLDLPQVPLLYRGSSFDTATAAWHHAGRSTETSEGYVIRNAAAIPYDQFALHVAKWVRPNHVTTTASWRHRDDHDLNTFSSDR